MKNHRYFWAFAIVIFFSCMSVTIHTKAGSITHHQTEVDTPNVAANEKNGFYKENGTTRYYENGIPHKGFLTLKNKKYYFNSKGKMVTGSIRIKNNYYYFNSKGIMKTGFITRNYKGTSIKAHYNKKGRLQTGTFKVSKTEYKAKKSGEIYSVKNLATAICQRPQLPTGCEITAWTMMANYAGVRISKTKAANVMPRSSNPNYGFMGSPYSSGGWGLIVYPGGLKSMTKKYLKNYTNMTGYSLSKIKSKLWKKHLVLVWVTRLDGFDSHTVALTGYDQTGFFYNDLWTGTKRKMSYKYFRTIWAGNSYRAMSY